MTDKRLATKAESLIAWARSQLGCPYIFGAAGQTCTPSYRQSVMQNKPTYAEAIKRNCPVLMGKQPTCAGCKYNGRPSYDCRGLTRLALKAATGRMLMGAGATSQWNDASNWAQKGLIKDMPNTPCFVFVAKGSTMSHTGIYIGGSVIHASGHNSGVIESPMPRSWTHYGIPVGLYEGSKPMPLKKGSKGVAVKTLQTALISLGYNLPRYGADGDYGNETETAVRAFQLAHSLPVDGVWDEECQEVLEERIGIVEEPAPVEDLVIFKRADWEKYLEAVETLLSKVI